MGEVDVGDGDFRKGLNGGSDEAGDDVASDPLTAAFGVGTPDRNGLFEDFKSEYGIW